MILKTKAGIIEKLVNFDKVLESPMKIQHWIATETNGWGN